MLYLCKPFSIGARKPDREFEINKFQNQTTLITAMLKKLLILPLLAVTASATPPIPHQIVLTETSDTSLTATYDGVSLLVFNSAPDHWQVGDVLTSVVGSAYGVFGTPEPENPSEVNLITFGGATSGDSIIYITSDDNVIN